MYSHMSYLTLVTSNLTVTIQLLQNKCNPWSLSSNVSVVANSGLTSNVLKPFTYEQVISMQLCRYIDTLYGLYQKHVEGANRICYIFRHISKYTPGSTVLNFGVSWGPDLLSTYAQVYNLSG